MTPDEISAELDKLCAVARTRMDAAGVELRALRPAEADWFTADEYVEFERLSVAWLAATREHRSCEAAKARVAIKRRLRVEAMARGEER